MKKILFLSFLTLFTISKNMIRKNEKKAYNMIRKNEKKAYEEKASDILFSGSITNELSEDEIQLYHKNKHNAEVCQNIVAILNELNELIANRVTIHNDDNANRDTSLALSQKDRDIQVSNELKILQLQHLTNQELLKIIP